MIADLQTRAALMYARVGITGLLLAIAVAGFVVQTIRVEGLSIWPLKIEGWKAKAERLDRVVDGVKAAQIEAHRMADEARKAREEYHRQQVREADEKLQEAMDRANDDAARFIARNRVRATPDRSASSAAPAPADRGDPEGIDGPDPLSLVDAVLVEAEDIRICTSNTARLLIAQEWAEGINLPVE